MSGDRQKAQRVDQLVSDIYTIWRKGEWRELGPYMHERIVMALPGFAGSAVGRDEVLAGFRDFAENATLLEYGETDRRIDVVGDTAVATVAFEVTYERDGRTYAGSGRDFWVFGRSDDQWLAVWRTLLDMEEEAVNDTGR